MPTNIPAVVPNWIGGNEVPASGGALAVLCPANGRQLCEVGQANATDVDRAVSAASEAQRGWGSTSPVQRGQLLYRFCDLLATQRDELAEVIALEAGKRLSDAAGEVDAAIQCGRFFAAEGQRLFGRTMPSAVANKYAMTVRRPCGVAALIIAANTPAPNFAWKVFPALICGNAVVLKAAEDTPVSAWLMSQLAHESGLPAGVLNVLNGRGEEFGAQLVTHDRVDVVSFTGSTRVGRLIAEQTGRGLKRVSLELGGKNPLVVCDDADLDAAVSWVVASAFSNAGQRCASCSRVIVFEAVLEAFSERLVAATRALKLGVGEDSDVGPVINEHHLRSMLEAVAGAVERGARLETGGKRASGAQLDSGFFMEPTVLSNIAPDDALSAEELFGPITAIYKAQNYEDALRLANGNRYGLTASIHTRSVDRALDFAHSVSAGVAVVNGGTHGSEPHMPFGGLRDSGNGSREPGTEALDVYSELKDVYLNVTPGQL